MVIKGNNFLLNTQINYLKKDILSLVVIKVLV